MVFQHREESLGTRESSSNVFQLNVKERGEIMGRRPYPKQTRCHKWQQGRAGLRGACQVPGERRIICKKESTTSIACTSRSTLDSSYLTLCEIPRSGVVVILQESNLHSSLHGISNLSSQESDFRLIIMAFLSSHL